ncbi:hypothetical protein [Rhodococcus sp. SGAir0479]|uniref:hypothetical protein n=1 Tax=Rhodococcus sp. SGAir0479 TaxID=2567884 RepID=UPI0010CD4306|nr:hypothetical protein [Rhodococcus sp. SGAir0479]QCQ92500.1 hypothetical protein E7742_15590 [Rhodococcus sp. SGAir0479]
MKLRSFAVRAFGAAAVATAAVTGFATTASAAPAPGITTSPFGPIMPTLGQNDFCNGIIDTAVETDPARPGVATVALTPRGMHGIGPGWAANPTCRVKVTLRWNLDAFGLPTGQVKEIDLLAGEAPGQTVRTDIHTGSGPAAATIGATWFSPWFNELRPQISWPVQTYFLVP